eukprot:1026427-Rhodomonas_salina.5
MAWAFVFLKFSRFHRGLLCGRARGREKRGEKRVTGSEERNMSSIFCLVPLSENSLVPSWLSKSGLRLLEAVLDAADRRLHLFSIEVR